MAKRARAKIDPRDVAEEIVRRALAEGDGGKLNLPYVVRLSDPPTKSELLKLTACRIAGVTVTVMPAKALTVEEWVARYAPRK